MMKIRVRKLPEHHAEILIEVENGEDITITYNGEVVVNPISSKQQD
jgi:antitoxin (DNA-binding transcriptional repressor) of toxin-antitoxin stability system